MDRSCRRYAPQRPFPPYRHLPGETTDPREFRRQGPPIPAGQPLTSANWEINETYLYGADLFNFSYWWEAHEEWEDLWRRADPLCGLYLQGLIQISAAFIKWHQGNQRGRERLLGKGQDKLLQVRKELGESHYMGLDLIDFGRRLHCFFALGGNPRHGREEDRVSPLIRLAPE